MLPKKGWGSEEDVDVNVLQFAFCSREKLLISFRKELPQWPSHLWKRTINTKWPVSCHGINWPLPVAFVIGLHTGSMKKSTSLWDSNQHRCAGRDQNLSHLYNWTDFICRFLVRSLLHTSTRLYLQITDFSCPVLSPVNCTCPKQFLLSSFLTGLTLIYQQVSCPWASP